MGIRRQWYAKLVVSSQKKAVKSRLVMPQWTKSNEDLPRESCCGHHVWSWINVLKTAFCSRSFSTWFFTFLLFIGLRQVGCRLPRAVWSAAAAGSLIRKKCLLRFTVVASRGWGLLPEKSNPKCFGFSCVLRITVGSVGRKNCLSFKENRESIRVN